MTAALRYFAISILLLYAWFVASDSLLNVGLSDVAVSLRLNLVRPVSWLIVALCLIDAWGLGKRFAWAWWLGVVGALVQLARMGWWVAHHHSLSQLPGTDVWLAAAMLLSFLVVLLVPAVRRACAR
ncbi:hypothetical protein G3580_17260 [Nitrogeniibacter mangrovi]|uniref:Uncharacterized protein n=1 Tax=Nitrogeniibacter mangrovi TaxID=2016596 RepID=A0A6C1B667_9RHOO|nr:hypothetical protein [Nitrogeniibacter mangrovi]QID19212.1 hypothetical protein G3580_17260 [Nitrogeniibacter mangrovi]